MALNVIARGGKALVTIPAGAAIAVHSAGIATLSTFTTYAQQPPQLVFLASSVAGSVYVSSTFTNGATIQVEAPYNYEVFYEVGTAPIVQFLSADAGQMNTAAGAAQAFNATGTLTIANLMGQIITSSTAAAVAATLPTGTVLDAGSSFNIGDWYEFSVINTGGANAITLTTATGWTLVGTMAVAASTSGRFRIVKTAAATFTLYRVS
jgi:hypothetical protein